MLPIVTFGPFQGWKPAAIGGAPHWKEICMHRFEATSDGQLAHYTDDQIRAIVPPESWADYLTSWPEAAPIVEGLTKPTPAPVAPPL